MVVLRFFYNYDKTVLKICCVEVFWYYDKNCSKMVVLRFFNNCDKTVLKMVVLRR